MISAKQITIVFLIAAAVFVGLTILAITKLPHPTRPSLLNQVVKSCIDKGGVPILEHHNGERLTDCKFK